MECHERPNPGFFSSHYYLRFACLLIVSVIFTNSKWLWLFSRTEKTVHTKKKINANQHFAIRVRLRILLSAWKKLSDCIINLWFPSISCRVKCYKCNINLSIGNTCCVKQFMCTKNVVWAASLHSRRYCGTSRVFSMSLLGFKQVITPLKYGVSFKN